MYKNTYHRDGTVTYWNVYAQKWERLAAEDIGDEILSSMSESERKRIERMADKSRAA